MCVCVLLDCLREHAYMHIYNVLFNVLVNVVEKGVIAS